MASTAIFMRSPARLARDHPFGARRRYAVSMERTSRPL
jgi:hypothetical protein